MDYKMGKIDCNYNKLLLPDLLYKDHMLDDGVFNDNMNNFLDSFYIHHMQVNLYFANSITYLMD